MQGALIFLGGKMSVETQIAENLPRDATTVDFEAPVDYEATLLMERKSDGIRVALWMLQSPQQNEWLITYVDEKSVPYDQMPEVHAISLPEGQNPLASPKGPYYHPTRWVEG